MDKFCTYCGRPLKDGEKCDCRQKKKKANSENKNNNLNMFLKNFFKLIVNAFKRPSSTMKIFVANLDYKYGIVLVVLNSLFLSLTTMMGLIRVNYSGMLFGLYFSNKALLYTVLYFLVLLATAVLFVLFVMLFMSGIGAKKANVKQAICVVGAKSLGLLPFAVLGFLASVFYPSWGTGLVSIGEILGYLFAYFAFREVLNDNEDVSVYSFFLAAVCEIASKSILISLIDTLLYTNNFIF